METIAWSFVKHFSQKKNIFLKRILLLLLRVELFSVCANETTLAKYSMEATTHYECLIFNLSYFYFKPSQSAEVYRDFTFLTFDFVQVLKEISNCSLLCHSYNLNVGSLSSGFVWSVFFFISKFLLNNKINYKWPGNFSKPCSIWLQNLRDKNEHLEEE